jgi:hypothetical protein
MSEVLQLLGVVAAAQQGELALPPIAPKLPTRASGTSTSSATLIAKLSLLLQRLPLPPAAAVAMPQGNGSVTQALLPAVLT